LKAISVHAKIRGVVTIKILISDGFFGKARLLRSIEHAFSDTLG